MTNLVTLDGSSGEGGGQIIRTALALSALTGKPFKITNIRANRPKPGLSPQHLTCIKVATELTGAKVEGSEIGSTEVLFAPGKFKAKSIDIDIGTAGSITLFLQSIMLPYMLSKKNSKITIKGGTDVNWSMPADYLVNVFLPQLNKYAKIGPRITRRGYYPKGNGEIEIRIKSFFDMDSRKEAQKIELLSQGELISVKGIAHSSADLTDSKVSERIANSAKVKLASLKCPVSIGTEYCSTPSTGAGITLWAICSLTTDDISYSQPIRLGGSCLGEKGKKSEDVGVSAAEELITEIESRAPIDEHLADNLIPYLAIFGGEIKVSRISEHTLTNIEVVQKFLDVNFKVDKERNTIAV